MSAPLTLGDIVDLRAYERQRDEFRARIIELKQRRRVAVGPFVSLVFENRDTLLFQVQEMARAERMLTDEQIQVELDTYNPLLPSAGELSATLFIELTSKLALMEWLPRLVGIEQAPYVEVDGRRHAATVDPDHAEQLTREDVTASVHYVRIAIPEPARAAWSAGATVRVGIAHPEYEHATVLAPEVASELLNDLGGG